MEHDPQLRKTLEIAREYLGKDVHVVFDRLVGTTHPKHAFKYEINYGYVPGVKAADGEELDAYYMGTQEPLIEADGICIAIIHRENDDDDKLIIAPKGTDFSDEEIRSATNFQEQWFKSIIVRK